jgi:hypothetical protein
VNTTRRAIENYVRAKDHNRPYLIEGAFAPNVVLEMIVNTGTISFPPLSRGLEAISNVLVRQFAQTYENVHTFCLTSAPKNEPVQFSCPWLVGMSEKETRRLRVGCGRYNWFFQSTQPRLVDRLSITIDVMEALPPGYLVPVMNWLSHLPYPWCPAAVALEFAPSSGALGSIRQYLHDVRLTVRSAGRAR